MTAKNSETITIDEIDVLARDLETLYLKNKKDFQEKRISKSIFEKKNTHILEEIDCLLKKKEEIQKQIKEETLKEIDELRLRLQNKEIDSDTYAREYLKLYEKMEPLDSGTEQEKASGKEAVKEK